MQSLVVGDVREVGSGVGREVEDVQGGLVGGDCNEVVRWRDGQVKDDGLVHATTYFEHAGEVSGRVDPDQRPLHQGP